MGSEVVVRKDSSDLDGQEGTEKVEDKLIWWQSTLNLSWENEAGQNDNQYQSSWQWTLIIKINKNLFTSGLSGESRQLGTEDTSTQGIVLPLRQGETWWSMIIKEFTKFEWCWKKIGSIFHLRMWSHYSGSLTLTRAAQSQRGWDSNFEVENTKTQSQKIQKHIKKAQVSQVVMQEARMGFKLLKKRLGIQDVSIINENKVLFQNIPNKVNILRYTLICSNIVHQISWIHIFESFNWKLKFHWQTLPGITYRHCLVCLIHD